MSDDGDADERRQELVEALRVAPFISADESLRRCREGADEILELIEIAATWKARAESWEALATRAVKDLTDAVAAAAPSQSMVN